MIIVNRRGGIMKRISSFLIVFCIVLSLVGAVFAEDADIIAAKKPAVREIKEDIKDTREGIKNARIDVIANKRELLKAKNFEKLSDERKRKLASLERAELKKYANLTDDQLKARLDRLKLKDIKTESDILKRKIPKEKAEKLERYYLLSMGRYFTAKKEYKDHKKEFLEIRVKIKACQNQTEVSDECKRIGEEVLASAKTYVSSIADTMVNQLQTVKTRIESSESLSEEGSNRSVAQINRLITKVEEIKTKIAGVKTKAEFRETVAEMNRLTFKFKRMVKIRAAGLMHDGVGRLIKLAEITGKKAECSISQLQEEGRNTTALDSSLDSYYDKISSAKESFEQARSLILSGTDNAVRDAKSKINDARARLKEAQDIMKSLRDAIKDNGGKQCRKEEVTVAEEAEEKPVTEEITDENTTETENTQTSSTTNATTESGATV